MFIAICGTATTAKEKKVDSPVKKVSIGVIVPVTPKLVDIFINGNEQQPTGFEANNWLRLAKRGNSWVQSNLNCSTSQIHLSFSEGNSN